MSIMEKEITKTLKRISKNSNNSLEKVFEEFLDYCFEKTKGSDVYDYEPVYDDLYHELWEDIKKYPRDILGEVWNNLGLYNKYKGEFYIPYEISMVISRLSFMEKEEKLRKNKTLSVTDAACGSGAMLIAFISCMKNNGYKMDQVYFYGNESNMSCIKMAYIQLWMLGANAALTHYDEAVDGVFTLHEITQQKRK